MNATEIQNPWLAQRAREIRESIDELRRDVAPLPYLQLGWRPPDGGWSIAQVVEHLIITDESYMAVFERVLAQPPKVRGIAPWRPSLIGGLLTRSQMPDSKKKLTTPAQWRPGPQPRADVVEAYIKVRERLLDLLARADGYDLRRTKLSSPAAKLIRINLGDAFMTLIVHAQRHLRQIERIKRAMG